MKKIILLLLILGVIKSNAQDFITGKLLNVGFSGTITGQPWGNPAFDRNFGDNHFLRGWNWGFEEFCLSLGSETLFQQVDIYLLKNGRKNPAIHLIL